MSDIIHNPKPTGADIFYHAKVIGTNDHHNQGRVRIEVAIKTQDDYIDHIELGPEKEKFAEVLGSKGTGHGIYYNPEFGDTVICMDIGANTYIIGAINNPIDTPAEAQNISTVTNDYWANNYPSLVDKKYHDPSADYGSAYHPDSFFIRWRKNDILFLNTKQVNDKIGTTQKLMEFRTNENQLFQMVDIGNADFEAGKASGDINDGNNSKAVVHNRQSDYRDLWDGLPINHYYWTQKQDHAPDTHESQYIRLATNDDCYHEVAPPKHHGMADPSLNNGNSRLDDRTMFGQHETSKTYCEAYQQPKIEKTNIYRYRQDEEDPSVITDSSKKNIYHIDQIGTPEVSQSQQTFNFGHHLTVSNTIYKKRVQIETKKKHQLIMSDIDLDEKLILRSMRKKYIYMEDSDPDKFDFMQIHNGHSINIMHRGVFPGLQDDTGATRDCMPDGAVSKTDVSSYLFIQTEKKMRTWYSDTPKSQRIHTITTKGHEILLCDDHQMGSMDKIQITTHDKTMQQVFNVLTNEISLMNSKGKTKIYSKDSISIDSGNTIWVRAKGQITVHSESSVNVDAPSINLNCGSYGPHSPFGPLGTPTSTLDTPNKIHQDEKSTPE